MNRRPDKRWRHGHFLTLLGVDGVIKHWTLDPAVQGPAVTLTLNDGHTAVVSFANSILDGRIDLGTGPGRSGARRLAAGVAKLPRTAH
jgi:hypothetical protein